MVASIDKKLTDQGGDLARKLHPDCSPILKIARDAIRVLGIVLAHGH